MYGAHLVLRSLTSDVCSLCHVLCLALMRHLFSLDAISGDDTLRTHRRAAVHRIKHALTRIERCTTRMLRLQYVWKKRVQHADEPVQTAPAATATTVTDKTSPIESTPVTGKSRTPTPSPQGASRSIPSSPAAPTRNMASPAAPARNVSSAALPTRHTKRDVSRSPVRSPAPSPSAPARSVHVPTAPARAASPPSSPRFHVTRQSDGLLITASLPDVSRDTLDITVRGRLLRIAGVCHEQPFLREMELPDTCDVERLDAAWDDDTQRLRVRVPIVKRAAPTRYMYDDEDDVDVDQDTTPYHYQPAVSHRCAPSYAHARPSMYAPRSRPVFAAPRRSMFGSPFSYW